MDVLGALNLGDIAQTFSKMGMFPVFDLAYYIVSILYLKYEPGQWLFILPRLFEWSGCYCFSVFFTR